jgi:hypothetical protein
MEDDEPPDADFRRIEVLGADGKRPLAMRTVIRFPKHPGKQHGKSLPYEPRR